MSTEVLNNGELMSESRRKINDNFIELKQEIVRVEGEIPLVIDNLTSTGTTSALSAKQGKILNEKIVDLPCDAVGTVITKSFQGFEQTDNRFLPCDNSSVEGSDYPALATIMKGTMPLIGSGIVFDYSYNDSTSPPIFANGNFLKHVYAGDTVKKSTNGLDWSTFCSLPASYTLFSSANGLYFCTDDYEDKFIYVSTDTKAKKWTKVTIPTPIINYEYYGGVVYGNGVYVMVGSKGTVWVSTDGTGWLNKGVIASDVWGRGGLCFGDGMFITSLDNDIYTSTNGIDWTLRNTSAESVQSIVYGNGKFVCGRSNGVTISEDGINWTEVEIEKNFSNEEFDDLAYGDGLFFSRGTDGAPRHSTDGVHWYKTRGMAHLPAYGNGAFVTISSSGEYEDYTIHAEAYDPSKIWLPPPTKELERYDYIKAEE